MTDSQFEQLLNGMNRIETRLDKIELRLDILETKVDRNTAAIKDLTRIVKKNHPGDFK